jgi:RNA polymerase sigma-70 factor (ECF subfamily)
VANLAERELETSLAGQLLAGKAEAFDRFVEHFRAKIFQYSWLMCRHREDAEEVAQETLLKVFENFNQLREPERVRPWVFRIAKNACLTKRRRSVFAPTPSQEIALDDLMPNRKFQDGGFKIKIEIADWSHVPETQALQSEMKRELEAAVRALPDMYRSVILLRDVEGLSTQEAAHILDVTEDVVKTRLHRARLAVGKQLDGSLRSSEVR